MKSTILTIAIASLTGFTLAADREKGDLKDPDSRADFIIKHCDTDKNGTLSRKEFAQSNICQELRKKRGAEEVQKQFTDADNNKDGELSSKELARMDIIKRTTHGPGPGPNKKKKGKVKGKK